MKAILMTAVSRPEVLKLQEVAEPALQHDGDIRHPGNCAETERAHQLLEAGDALGKTVLVTD